MHSPASSLFSRTFLLGVSSFFWPIFWAIRPFSRAAAFPPATFEQAPPGVEIGDIRTKDVREEDERGREHLELRLLLPRRLTGRGEKEVRTRNWGIVCGSQQEE
jgi:hypothetical protein